MLSSVIDRLALWIMDCRFLGGGMANLYICVCLIVMLISVVSNT